MYENSDTAFSQILKLPLRSVLRSESDYLKYYEIRCKQLSKQRPDAPYLGKKFDEGLEKTRSAHYAGTSLSIVVKELTETFPSNEDEALDRVYNAVVKIAELSYRRSKAPAAVIENLNRVNKKAIKYFKEIILTPTSDPNVELGDALDKLIQNERKVDQLSIRAQIPNILSQYKQLQDAQNVGEILAALAELYRGILYSGIINEFGDDLDKKKMKKTVENLMKSLVDELVAIPFKGLVEQMLQLISDALKLGDKPEESRNAADYENYITQYTGLLDHWIEVTNVLHENIKDIAPVVFDLNIDQNIK